MNDDFDIFDFLLVFSLNRKFIHLTLPSPCFIVILDVLFDKVCLLREKIETFGKIMTNKNQVRN